MEKATDNDYYLPGHNPLNNEEGQTHTQLYAAHQAHILGIRGYNLHFDPTSRLITKRVYLDWMPHGSLASLLRYYDNQPERRWGLPEPFIWYIFKALTEVCLISWNGHAGRGRRPGWDCIVNVDIKPENILLAPPDPKEPLTWARQYPKPKMADFGAAWTTYRGLDDTLNQNVPKHKRRSNPNDFWFRGTTGHMPPELFKHDATAPHTLARYAAARSARIAARLDRDLPLTHGDGTRNDGAGIDAWTMVWQIGMTLWCLMAGERRGGYDERAREFAVDFADDGRDAPARRPPARHPLRPAYSGRLVELAYQCMAFSPEARIGLEDLWGEVLDGLIDAGLSIMAPPDSYRGRGDDRVYDEYSRPSSSYRARDRSSDYDSYRRAPSSHSHSSYHERPDDAYHYDQRRAPRRTSPEYDAYYDRDRPRERYYDDRRRGSHYHPSDRSQSPYRRNEDRHRRRGSHQSDLELYAPDPLNVVRRHAPNAEHDAAFDGQHTQFLLVSGLHMSTDEKALAEGLAQLYKADEDTSAATGPSQPAPGAGLRSTGLKPTGLKPTSVPRNPGAKKDSLKRVFLIREKRSRLSCGYGLAEFHSKEVGIQKCMSEDV
ncbi:Rna-binding protein [Neofusicoccum parvum]|uniref:Rna-binding protein n=1 Tax=Neofusicoccum parvum TaxID=310453 RepID=A0ACB5SGX5_9PEZI|nr:Rna-binding protein [Neofusicoccum parvum]